MPGMGPYASQPGGSGATRAGGFREAALVRLIPVALGLGGCRDLLLGFAFPFGTGVPHSWVPGETPLSFLFLPTVRIFILLEIFLIFHLC